MSYRDKYPDFGHLNSQSDAEPRNIIFLGEKVDLTRYAKGNYQLGLTTGENRWSGADIGSHAGRYSASYESSRRSLLERMREGGVPFGFAVYGKHRRVVLVVGESSLCAKCANRFPKEDALRDSEGFVVCMSCGQGGE
jgi:hypothetical protein